MKSSSQIVFYINGIRHAPPPTQWDWMLADYLREQARLTGTKIVCAEGDCGACSVLWAKPSALAALAEQRKRDAANGPGKSAKGSSAAAPFVAVNSCIMRVAQCDGGAFVTVEALGSTAAPTPSADCLSEVQCKLREAGGSQCGFCTPGFVVALSALTDRRKATGAARLSEQDVKNALTGNLCRCTGYAPIVAGGTDVVLDNWQSLATKWLSPTLVKDLLATRTGELSARTEDRQYWAPTKAPDVSRALTKGYRIVAGGTDVGVLLNKGKASAPKHVSLQRLPEFDEIQADKQRVHFGANVTIAEARRALESRFDQLASYLDLFASPQIKNIATLVGNIANGSPIGDATAALMACDARVGVVGGKRQREVALAELYTGYRQMCLVPGEWIGSVSLALPGPRDHVRFLKSSQRKDLDISAVNAGLWLRVDKKQPRIAEAKLSVGGVGPTVTRLTAVEARLSELAIPADTASIQSVIDAAQKAITPLSDLRGSAAFRRVVLGNWLGAVLSELLAAGPGPELSAVILEPARRVGVAP